LAGTGVLTTKILRAWLLEWECPFDIVLSFDTGGDENYSGYDLIMTEVPASEQGTGGDRRFSMQNALVRTGIPLVMISPPMPEYLEAHKKDEMERIFKPLKKKEVFDRIWRFDSPYSLVPQKCPVLQNCLENKVSQKEEAPKPIRILLAEDNLVNQKVILSMLKPPEYLITVVGDGTLVLEGLQDQDFDLILMDVQMPVMGGIETSQRIRESKIGTPIVALTANAMKGDREKCIEAGMDDYLAKPIVKARLIELIQNFCR